MNYSTHAIESLTRFGQTLSFSAPHSAKMTQHVVRWLDQGIKFSLPDGGNLVELEQLDPSFFELMRLPYPICVLEVPFVEHVKNVKGQLDGVLAETASTRRIALLVECEQFFKDFEPLLKGQPVPPGFVVMSVYYSDPDDMWLMAPQGVVLNDESAHTLTHHSQEPNRMMIDALAHTGALKPKSSVVQLMHLNLLPEIVKLLQNEIGPEAANTRLHLDVRDEVLLAMEFCLVLNCTNIRTREVLPSAKLNKKRINSGKLPFYSHHVLEIDSDEVGMRHSLYASEAAGSGRTVRMHTRRGHLRRLSTGKVTFVRAALVGRSGGGIISKEYSVSKPQRTSDYSSS
mgnify:CR=1 FL=1